MSAAVNGLRQIWWGTQPGRGADIGDVDDEPIGSGHVDVSGGLTFR